jgi:hypothetical protein
VQENNCNQGNDLGDTETDVLLLCHREELKRAESENKQLCESLLAQQNHQRALNELHDQTARREGDMNEKIKALEKELQVLCPNCVIVLSWFTC